MGTVYLDHEIDPKTGKELGTLRLVSVELKSKDFTGHDVTTVIAVAMNDKTGEWDVIGVVSGNSPSFGKAAIEGIGPAAVSGLLQVWANQYLPGLKVQVKNGSSSEVGPITNSNSATGGAGGTGGNGGAGGTANSNASSASNSNSRSNSESNSNSNSISDADASAKIEADKHGHH